MAEANHDVVVCGVFIGDGSNAFVVKAVLADRLELAVDARDLLGGRMGHGILAMLDSRTARPAGDAWYSLSA